MRIVLLLALLAIAACRPIYGRDVANLTAFPEDLPAVGTSAAMLDEWFDKLGYAPGPHVFQSESELRRQPGAPLVYALETDRSWWLMRARTTQDFCTTQKFIYYKLDHERKLQRAIQNKRSVC
jgi:hypothetical protein